MKLVAFYGLKWNLIIFCFLLELNLLCIEINNHCNYVPFCKFKWLYYSDMYLHFIVELIAGIRPCTTICTNHIPTMPQVTKIKSISFCGHNIFVAHSNSNPIWAAFPDFKGVGLNFVSFFDRRFHNSKLVAGCILRLDMVIRYNLDIIVLEYWWEPIDLVFFPDVGGIDRLFEIFLVLLQFRIYFSNILWNHFIYVLVADIKRCNQLTLSNIQRLIIFLLFVCGNHGHQFFYP